MQVKYVYLADQFADVEPYLDEVRELVASGEFTLGPYVDRLERRFAEYLNIKHVISTNNGTDALILCLKALGIGAGDEVITVANTFYATAGAIVAVGATPVFVDCDERYQIDVSKIEAVITKKTKAILPVHWTGASPDMEAILKIGQRHSLPIVEDACPAVGAKIGNKMAGTFGTISAFSMHPLKPLNVWGDGGAIVTNDDSLAAFLRLYRNHGMVDRDHIDIWGINARIQPVQAIVARRQLDIMEEIVGTRNQLAARLDQGLRSIGNWVRVPERPTNHRGAYQLYIAGFERRDELLKYLQKNEIEAKVHYPVPLHLQKPGRALGYKEGDFPIAERQAKEIITLPCHQHLSHAHIDFMIETIAAFYRA